MSLIVCVWWPSNLSDHVPDGLCLVGVEQGGCGHSFLLLLLIVVFLLLLYCRLVETGSHVKRKERERSRAYILARSQLSSAPHPPILGNHWLPQFAHPCPWLTGHWKNTLIDVDVLNIVINVLSQKLFFYLKTLIRVGSDSCQSCGVFTCYPQHLSHLIRRDQPKFKSPLSCIYMYI